MTFQHPFIENLYQYIFAENLLLAWSINLLFFFCFLANIACIMNGKLSLIALLCMCVRARAMENFHFSKVDKLFLLPAAMYLSQFSFQQKAERKICRNCWFFFCVCGWLDARDGIFDFFFFDFFKLNVSKKILNFLINFFHPFHLCGFSKLKRKFSLSQTTQKEDLSRLTKVFASTFAIDFFISTKSNSFKANERHIEQEMLNKLCRYT